MDILSYDCLTLDFFIFIVFIFEINFIEIYKETINLVIMITINKYKMNIKLIDLYFWQILSFIGKFLMFKI